MMKTKIKKPTPTLERWRRDPVAFIREVLVNPESAKPFVLHQAEIDFLREGLTPKPDGSLPYPELLFSGPKKSGKSTFAAMCMLFVIIALAGNNGEGIILANDQEQATDRIFQACVRIIKASPLLRNRVRITATKIEFISTGSTIVAIASDAPGAAGSNPNFVCGDEIWGFTSERQHRLWDECLPSPTRRASARLVTSYAGFVGESELLENLYKRGLQGKQIAPSLYRQRGLLMAWHREPVAPWQTPEWVEQMRATLRPNQFLRMISNEWVTTESEFVPLSDWDRCVDPDFRPLVRDPRLPVWLGVDASLKHDSTAIAACAWDAAAKSVRLIWHRVFQPTSESPLDFEATIEATIYDLRARFQVRLISFDPWQMASTAQRLAKAGLPLAEFNQTPGNLTEASSNLFELIKGHNLIVYPDDDMRLALSRCVAVESSRGWRITKEKSSHRIDVIIALAQAALGAAKQMGQEHYTSAIFSLNGVGLGAQLSGPGMGADDDSLAPVEETDLDVNAGSGICAGCNALIGTGAVHWLKRKGQSLVVCGVCFAKLTGRRTFLRC